MGADVSEQIVIGEAPPRSPRDRRARAGLGLRVLCVEDDEQVLTVLTALLESEGYEVASAMTAAQGLAALERQPFHLVISDYWLPDKTGAWMLGEASRTGTLGTAQVLVITAEHRPQGVENLNVLKKPLDLDDFLRVVHDVLAPMRQQELQRAKEEVQRVHQVEQPGGGPVKIELTLYISSSSPSSLKALRNLRGLLSGYDAAQVRLVVIDLSKEGSAEADEDRIAFTPTLVKRRPDPKVWILGDLEDAEIVSDLLGHSGVDRQR